jgi:hypothetical protein
LSASYTFKNFCKWQSSGYGAVSVVSLNYTRRFRGRYCLHHQEDKYDLVYVRTLGPLVRDYTKFCAYAGKRTNASMVPGKIWTQGSSVISAYDLHPDLTHSVINIIYSWLISHLFLLRTIYEYHRDLFVVVCVLCACCVRGSISEKTLPCHLLTVTDSMEQGSMSQADVLPVS